MGPARARFHRKTSPVFEASEPRSFDRKFYMRALIVAFLVIVVSGGFAIYLTAFNTATSPRGPSFDLSSLAVGGRELPDPENPCIVLQEHLDATRLKSYRRAYDYLSEGLRKTTSFDAFVSNARANRLLFRDVSGYRFSEYKVDGAAASASGYLMYEPGGRSEAQATFEREGSSWKISLITVIYR
jgi:hypothetical protein